jgi:hypothetical protein
VLSYCKCSDVAVDVYFALFVVSLQIRRPELPEGRMEKTGKFLVSFLITLDEKNIFCFM